MNAPVNNPRLAKMEALLPTLATKRHLQREINAQTRWLVTFVTIVGSGLTTAVYFVAKHVS
jgi:hypothetical protein